MPDEHGDWLNQRDSSFEQFIPIGDNTREGRLALFSIYSAGVKTNRDAWAFNASRMILSDNMKRMIEVYNAEAARFQTAHGQLPKKDKETIVDDFVTSDPKLISWSGDLKAEIIKGRRGIFREEGLVRCLYRPFTPQWLYLDRQFNNRVYDMPRLFPYGEQRNQNLLIVVPSPGNVTPFSTFMADMPCDLSLVAAKSGTQCFPRYLYDVENEPSEEAPQGELPIGAGSGRVTRRDAISDEGLNHFTNAYPGGSIGKDDVFYYVYGLLHSEEFRARYQDNLTKQFLRIPLMKRVEDFRAFVDAGRRLADLHLKFESATPYPVTIKEGDLRFANIPDRTAYFRVEKMKFGGKRPNLDQTTVIYNPRITITNIPLETYDYTVNGKSPVEWVMERQCVKTDPASSIVNDANRYAVETVGDPAYPFELLCRAITVSLETMKIVNDLPSLDIREV